MNKLSLSSTSMNINLLFKIDEFNRHLVNHATELMNQQKISEGVRNLNNCETKEEKLFFNYYYYYLLTQLLNFLLRYVFYS